MKLKAQGLARVPMLMAALAVAALSIATPAEAKDKHKKKDGHGHNSGHGQNGGNSHGEGHVDSRACGSHKHHHAHVWHGADHRQYRCPGHE